MKKLIAYIFVCSLLLLSISCGGGGDDGGNNPPDPENPTTELGSFNLSTPENNSLCVEGDYTVGGSLNHILLTWKPSENAKSYTINLIDNATSVSTTYTSVASSVEVDVEMGHSYSWKVDATLDGKSKSSETWSFYSRGEKVENYAPFPAEIALTDNEDGTIDIVWQTNDLDNDLDSYDVYFGTDTEPPLLLENLGVNENKILNQSILYNTTYYIKVVAIDYKGNSSTSHKVFKLASP